MDRPTPALCSPHGARGSVPPSPPPRAVAAASSPLRAPPLRTVAASAPPPQTPSRGFFALDHATPVALPTWGFFSPSWGLWAGWLGSTVSYSSRKIYGD